jgi:hypothetical protein
VRHRYFRAAVVVVGLVVGAAVVPSVAGAIPRPSAHKVTGGKTSITLNAKTRHAMTSNHYVLTATGPATLKGATLTTPVTSGTYAGFTADVKTAGGFRISNASTGVTISKVHSKSSSFSGTAKVSGHGRIKALTIGVPTSMSGSNPVTFSGYTVALAKPLVKLLDAKFGTRLFAKHAKIGTGSTTLKYSN